MWRKLILACCVSGLMLSAVVILAAGCQNKTERSITLEGPENKYEFELESTEKAPDDQD